MILDGYVCVSQVRGREGEHFISPAVQREQIEGWIALSVACYENGPKPRASEEPS